MSTFKATEVCRHCGGETELRFGTMGDRIHKRGSQRGQREVCKRTPDLIPRAEYEQRKAAASGASGDQA
jgi:hypothetical protein